MSSSDIGGVVVTTLWVCVPLFPVLPRVRELGLLLVLHGGLILLLQLPVVLFACEAMLSLT